MKSLKTVQCAATIVQGLVLFGATSFACRAAWSQELTVTLLVDGREQLQLVQKGDPAGDDHFRFNESIVELGYAASWTVVASPGTDRFCASPDMFFAVTLSGSLPSSQLELIFSHPVLPSDDRSAALRCSVTATMTASQEGGEVSSVGGEPMFQARIDGVPVFEAHAGASLTAGPFESAALTPQETGPPMADGPAPQSSLSWRLLVDLAEGVPVSIVGLIAAQRPRSPDLNGDDSVRGDDLGLLLGQWGECGTADLNYDGVVDGADLGLLLGAWG